MNTKRKLRLFGLVLATICAAVFALKILLPSNRLDDKEYQRRLARVFPGNSRTVLDNATAITLYSLDGSIDRHLSPTSLPGEFHGYQILGKTVLSGVEKERVVSGFYDGLADKTAFRAACFCPHHGLRVMQREQSVDMVVCFTCTTVMTYSNGTQGSSPIGKAPEMHFNQLLTAAGAPFARNYKP